MNQLAKCEVIPVKELKLGKYQRALEMVRAKKFAGEFDINKVGVIIVSERDGSYYVVDGQHRTFTAKLAGVKALMCQIIQGLTYEEEAELFIELNTTVKRPCKTDIFNADVEAKSKEALEIMAIVENLGLRISKTSGSNQIAAVKTLYTLYKKHGKEHLRDTLTLIKNTWNGEAYSLNNKVMTGVSQFIKVYKNEVGFTTQMFIKQLEKVEPIVLLRESNADYSSPKSEIRTANIIFKYYNNRLRKKLENKHYV